MGITAVTTKRSMLIYLCYLWQYNEEVYEEISVNTEPDEQETASLHRCMVGVACALPSSWLLSNRGLVRGSLTSHNDIKPALGPKEVYQMIIPLMVLFWNSLGNCTVLTPKECSLHVSSYHSMGACNFAPSSRAEST